MDPQGWRPTDESEVWLVDAAGVVRTPMSWLIPRARKAFVRLVGEEGLAAILAERNQRKTQPTKET
jgi:hypothetical protein